MSAEEKEHAVRKRVVTSYNGSDEVDKYPLIRIFRPVGSWGLTKPGLRKAQPFDGLMP